MDVLCIENCKLLATPIGFDPKVQQKTIRIWKLTLNDDVYLGRPVDARQVQVVEEE